MLAMVVAFIGGCQGKVSSPPPPPGTNSGTDAGVRADAGASFDAGSRDDAGSRFDGGPDLVDAGLQEDGGVALDAGTEVDAGTPFDAGIVLTTSGVVYPFDRTHSPIDGSVVQRLRDIVALGTGRPGVFARVGDSVSIGYAGVTGGTFLNCFDGILEGPVSWDVNIRLGANSALSPTIAFFKTTTVQAGPSSFTRVSLATRVGQTASWPMTGSPSYVDQELAAIRPRYAVVLYGSNDILWGGLDAYPLADQAERYEKHMRLLTDHLITKGVIPLLNTMPPRNQPRYLTYSPVLAGVVRAIAQGRQIPLIDLQRQMMAMGSPYGLLSDGTHPSHDDYNTCCWFDPASLARYGANVRNLITLESLDRMRQIFEANVPALDPAAPRLVGDGSVASPIVIDQVPWGELRDLRSTPSMATGALSCADAPPVSGPQNLYRLVLPRAMSVRVLALNGGVGGHQVSLLSSPDLSSCLKSDARLVTGPLAAGSYYIAVNALSPGQGTEYNLSVTECRPGDPDC